MCSCWFWSKHSFWVELFLFQMFQHILMEAQDQCTFCINCLYLLKINSDSIFFLRVKIFFSLQHSNFLDVYYHIWEMYQLTVEYLLLLAFSNQILPEFPCNWKQKCTILNSTIILYYLIRKPFHIMVIFFFKRKASGILDEKRQIYHLKDAGGPFLYWWSLW